ncbi:hypothetical protein [Brevibacterium luteolum]|uniref:hypothetical protein n=1 Tax=Brevibacterium luteolum TaxID=199591 RepID=UPI001C21CDA3|nr:hypothetical protein [Brevibacterium luteolum]MBU8579270.1 hypothetical protein [Brevibacterium luteolum]
MGIPLASRWIIALLLLAIGSLALVFAPGLHDLAAVFWGLALVSLIAALVIAVRRWRTVRRDESSVSSRRRRGRENRRPQ